MRVLVFTTDIIPLPGVPTSGTALRTHGFIEGFRSHGHDVIVSVPLTAVSGFAHTYDLASLDSAAKAKFDELRRFAFDGSNQAKIISDVNPDLIFCGHWPAMTLCAKPSQAVVIDLAGPHLLERHYQGMPNQIGAVLAKLNAVSKADYFVVSGPAQRLYFLSFLLRAEIQNPENRIVTIPMPLSPEIPKRPAVDCIHFPHFVFGGVFLPWQDPAQGLRQISTALSSRHQGLLSLIGGKHPNYDIKSGIYAELFDELLQNPRVKSLPLLPYPEFINELLTKDVAVDLMKWNLERQLAVTIRTTTYLWSGVPVIYNDYADLGRLISSYDAGWCVDPGNTAALDAVLAEIFDNPAMLRRKSENALRLAREMFSWDIAVSPLLNLLSLPATKRLRETDIILDFPDNAGLPVSREQAIEQYFVCRINGLTRVECRIATHNRTIQQPLWLSLYQLEKANGEYRGATKQLIARSELAGDALRNNEWCSLDIEPVADSAGKTFLFKIESDEEDALASASPWAVRGKPYPLLQLYHGENHIDNSSLCFRTTCAGSHE